jgi:hypothetical protein
MLQQLQKITQIITQKRIYLNICSILSASLRCRFPHGGNAAYLFSDPVPQDCLSLPAQRLHDGRKPR